MIGTPVSVDDVLRIARSDEAFFDASGGGITFTGGEPLAQPDFIEAATRALREHGYRSVVDTSGYAQTSALLRIAAYANLFLYDIKYMSNQIHTEICGVSNTLIHTNIMALADIGADVLISVPYIPGYTDTEDNVKATASFVASLKPAGRSRPYPVRILPYHNAAQAKYDRRGQVYRCAGVPIPSSDQLERAAAIFRSHAIETTIGGM